MYFSRVQLNPQRRHTRTFLANPRALHAAVEASFPPGARAEQDGRNLWRVDVVQHRVRLYMVSPTIPDMTHIVEQAGWATAPGDTVDYGSFLNGLTTGQQFAFKVTVNPVKRQFVPGERGKILPHVTEEQQLAWFRKRASSWGFAPLATPVLSGAAPGDVGGENALRVVERRNRIFGKPDAARRRTVTQRQVSIEGQLEVRDAAVFREALVNGMGRGKAYGCGLMTVARGR